MSILLTIESMSQLNSMQCNFQEIEISYLPLLVTA